MFARARSLSAAILRGGASLLPENHWLPRTTKKLWSATADLLDPRMSAPPEPVTLSVVEEPAPVKVYAPPPTPTTICADELREQLSSEAPPLLLDVREVHETDRGVIPGARLIPMGEVPAHVASLVAEQRPLVVYCAHGARSARVSSFLRDQGLSVLNLDGGIAAWATAGGEVRAPS